MHGPDTEQDLILLDADSLATDTRLREHQIPDSDVLRMKKAYDKFMAGNVLCAAQLQTGYFEVKSLPGLFVFPRLFPVELQIVMLDKLLHRDLSHPKHGTNLQLHYHMPDAGSVNESRSKHTSFYGLDRDLVVAPRDASIHKPVTMTQVLEKKLRWVTLGGQYDWTRKVYPEEAPPDFPDDIAELLRGAFPSVDPQAAILNFYSPGDTLSLHRDVSEECDQGLISLSIGCDALFLVANTDGSDSATIKLRSGDVVLMSGESRYAWHAVPRVIYGTCPESLKPWPVTTPGSAYEQWRGWLANKRLNLNVRQMRDK